MIYKLLIETNCYEDWQRIRDIFDDPTSTPMTEPYRFDIKASNAWREIKLNRDEEYMREQLFRKLNS